jgi:hypothetical protein
MNVRLTDPNRLADWLRPAATCAFLFLLFLGCTGHHKLYPGPARPANEVALLVVPAQDAGDGRITNTALLQITRLDAYTKPIRSEKDRTVRLEILPGPHELIARFNAAQWCKEHGSLVIWSLLSKERVTLKFDALANHTYYLILVTRKDSEGRKHWNAIIREDDQENGRILARGIQNSP